MATGNSTEWTRENMAARLIESLNLRARDAFTPELAASAAGLIERAVAEATRSDALQADLCRRIVFRPAAFQLASALPVRDAAFDLLAAGRLARAKLFELDAGQDPAVLALDAAIVKAERR